jgi:hypothetical protein
MFMKSNKLVHVLGYNLYSELRLHTFIYYNKNIEYIYIYRREKTLSGSLRREGRTYLAKKFSC